MKETNIKKELMITKPIIHTNPYMTHRLAFLLPHKSIQSWLYSNFINLWIGKDYTKSYWADFLYFSAYRACPFCRETSIDKRLINQVWSSIIDFIIDAIDSNGYVYLNVNTSYIDKYNYAPNTMHDIFIYGYDIENKELLVSDFFRDGQYSFERVKFQVLSDAYTKLNETQQFDFLNGVMVLHYNDTNYEFQIDFVVKCLTDYLNSINTSIATILQELDNDSDVSFGISAYGELCEYLLRSNNNYLDIRPFHYLCEHKTMMLHRLKYMHENEYINKHDFSRIYHKYETIHNECILVRNSLLKHKVKGNAVMVSDIKRKFDNIYKMEIESLENLLISIKI